MLIKEFSNTGAVTDQPVDLERIRAAVVEILEAIGEDSQRDGLLRTPDRVANMYAEVFAGLREDPEHHLKVQFEAGHDEMVLVKDIPFYSMCEHHLLPFVGKAHVAYIPEGKIIGLSKIPRIVEMYGRRLQVQERMTHQIAETINDVLSPKGVAVVLEGEHMCMQMRGVEKQNSYATTSSMIGQFRKDSKTRDEFLKIVALKK